MIAVNTPFFILFIKRTLNVLTRRFLRRKEKRTKKKKKRSAPFMAEFRRVHVVVRCTLFFFLHLVCWCTHTPFITIRKTLKNRLTLIYSNRCVILWRDLALRGCRRPKRVLNTNKKKAHRNIVFFKLLQDFQIIRFRLVRRVKVYTFRAITSNNETTRY